MTQNTQMTAERNLRKSAFFCAICVVFSGRAKEGSLCTKTFPVLYSALHNKRMLMERTHFIGIGGIGMSGIANILLEKKQQVSGSDASSGPITENLKKKGASIVLGQSSENISPGMTVVYSSGIRQDNPEFQAARSLGCKLLHRSEMLWHLMQEKTSLAVTGTHGKTTTSSLLSWVLHSAGLDPSFCVGGILPQLDTNGMEGRGDYFVIEADESDGSFLNYRPSGAIVTNIGLDHMDYYGNEKKLIDAFSQFFSQIGNPDLLFWCGDDTRFQKMKLSGVSYGVGPKCDLRCSNFRQEGWKSRWDMIFETTTYQNVTLPLIGNHNMLNASAVFGLCLRLGIPENKIRKGLETFSGVKRRCERKGEMNGILFLDDYAHHPTEIRSTLQAIRSAEPERRIIAVFQPHRYSRTRDCLGQYGTLFNAVDYVIVTDIYAAGEASIPGITAEKVLDEIRTASKVSCDYVPRDRIAEELASKTSPDSLVVTLGAGNITSAGPEAIAAMQAYVKS